MMDPKDRIEFRKDHLAKRRAWLDQQEKRFNDQYAFMSPEINRRRLDDLETWRFRLEIYEWELDEFIKVCEEDDEDTS